MHESIRTNTHICINMRLHKRSTTAYASPYHRILSHAHIEVGIAHPLHSILDRRYSPKHNLRVEIIHKMLDKATFNWQLVGEARKIMGKLAVRGDERGTTEGIKLWTTSTAKDLYQRRQVKLMQTVK